MRADGFPSLGQRAEGEEELNKRLIQAMSQIFQQQPIISISFHLGFPGGSDIKESACNAGNPSSTPGLGRSPGEGNGCSLQLPEDFHGLRGLASYRPRGRKEPDMTE